MKKINVGIIGHRGNIGENLSQILRKHPFAKIVYTNSLSKGERGKLAETEFVFLAMPDGKSEEYISRLDGQMIIDHSLDHRDEWTYGLPEIFRNEIQGSKRVACPGCYATAALLGMYPLKGKIDGLRVDAFSGVSGAGRDTPKSDNLHCYKVGRMHEQIGEIERVMELRDILFTPVRADKVWRGIIAIIHAKTNIAENLTELFACVYADSPFIRIKKNGSDIDTNDISRSNMCEIEFFKFGDNVLIVSAIDNLVKGGAGQAVQNFNLMCGFPETTGLI